MKKANKNWLSKKDFETVLQLMPIPCIDLIFEDKEKNLLFLKRNIPPYKNVWAFSGGRILKGETIREAIERIARNEIGIKIPKNIKARLVNVYSPKFKTEKNRQDVSICYFIPFHLNRSSLSISKSHYSNFTFRKNPPAKFGVLYKNQYNDFKKLKTI